MAGRAELIASVYPQETAMSDLATRLRRWTHAVDAVPASDLMDEAAGEIERLRELLAKAGERWVVAEMTARSTAATGHKDGTGQTTGQIV